MLQGCSAFSKASPFTATAGDASLAVALWAPVQLGLLSEAQEQLMRVRLALAHLFVICHWSSRIRSSSPNRLRILRGPSYLRQTLVAAGE